VTSDSDNTIIFITDISQKMSQETQSADIQTVKSKLAGIGKKNKQKLTTGEKVGKKLKPRAKATRVLSENTVCHVLGFWNVFTEPDECNGESRLGKKQVLKQMLLSLKLRRRVA
jgi:hypothetical protein